MATRTGIGRLIGAAVICTLSAEAWAQNLPPKDLQVPKVLCNQFPADAQATFNQLPAGGKWERVNAKSFVYGVRSADPLTNRVNEYRYMFVREDNGLSCGDTTPCAVLTRVAQNGFELRPYQFNQFCAALMINVGMSQPGLAEGMQREVSAAASHANDKQLNTVGGKLHIEGSLVLLNGAQVLIDMDPQDISIHSGWPKPGPARYALLTASSGGTACPALFRIVDATTRQATEPFGTCSDEPKASFDGEAVQVEFPSFRDAPAEAYRYQGGKLTKLK